MHSRQRHHRYLWGAVALLGAALGGCAAHGIVAYGEPAVYASGPPPGLYGAPYVYYRERPAYYVGGQWYYDSPGGWVVLRRAPRAWHDHRAYGHTHSPPRAYRPPAPSPRVHRAPNAYRPPPARAPRVYRSPARRW